MKFVGKSSRNLTKLKKAQKDIRLARPGSGRNSLMADCRAKLQAHYDKRAKEGTVPT